MEEKTDYENFLGKRAKEAEPATLGEFVGEEEIHAREWEKHWVGMPEFENEDNAPYKRLNISFRTKEDYDEFARLISQALTEKTKSIWYPALDRTGNALFRWIEEDHADES